MTYPKEGEEAPAFSAKDQDGNAINLRDYRGNKVVLFFYPKASTPGCTSESCNLRDNYEALLEKGFKIIGVSADSTKRQQNFRTKNQLPFPLIPDTGKEIINAYGVWGTKKMYGKEYEGIHRMTFLIDEKGKVAHVFTKVKTKEHAQQILEQIQ
ncbi:MAG: thioredoxin-dependent thiol peroxidase [Bacteroidales bacterium]|nr:thioredoxin-dependent thiol peroxidase [Bacteroidales bacterium]